MGREKYQRDVEQLFNKSTVVDLASIRRIINKGKKVKQYHKQLIRNMILKNKIRQLPNGNYTKHDDPSLAVFSFSPAYLGLQDALSFHDLWEQETIPVIITSRKARQGIRTVMGQNVLVRRINRKYMFGYEPQKAGDIYLPYADIEKTLIDLVYFRENINRDVMKAILEKCDRQKLEEYLKKYPDRIQREIKKKLSIEQMVQILTQ